VTSIFCVSELHLKNDIFFIFPFDIFLVKETRLNIVLREELCTGDHMRYSVKTKLKPEEVIERAVKFFGKGGVGLEVTSQDVSAICFEGGGGHVTIIVCPGELTDVDLETREWDYQVKRFMENIGK